VGEIRGLVFHPNNQQLITAGADGDVEYWQLPFPPARLLKGHESAIQALAVTVNGQLAVTASADSVRVFSVANGQPVRELAEMTGVTQAIAISEPELNGREIRTSGTVVTGSISAGIPSPGSASGSKNFSDMVWWDHRRSERKA
jgi:WD40 repeat protein